MDLTGLSGARWAMVLGTVGVLTGVFVLPWYALPPPFGDVGVSAWDAGDRGRLAALAALALVAGVGVLATRSELGLPFALGSGMAAAGALAAASAGAAALDTGARSPGSGLWLTLAAGLVVVAGGLADRVRARA